MKISKSEKLERTISKGKLHYIIWNGVIGWGVLTAITFSLLQHFIGDKSFTEIIWISLTTFPIGGILWGLVMWPIINRKYRKISSDGTK
ncbi:MAG TPA: hypothetical protein DHV36_21065 [Desulfobacteraceae bacterium]|nr:hypothetical protein [Desulfobacteraceae bacterium]